MNQILGQDGLKFLHIESHAEVGTEHERVEAVADVNEQGIDKQAIGPREKRGLMEQDKVIDTAESIRSGLPAGGMPHSLRKEGMRRMGLRFLGCAGMGHTEYFESKGRPFPVALPSCLVCCSSV